MAGTPRPETFQKDWEEMKRRLYALERGTRLNSASIGAGGLTVNDGGDIVLKDKDGEVVWQASQDPIRTAYDWAENNAMSVPTTWTDFWSSKWIAAPLGYGSGHFQLVVNVGDTFASEGNVGAQPRVQFELDDGTVENYSGPVANSGNNSVSVATSFFASNMVMTHQTTGAKVTRLRFGVRAIRVGAEASATAGNWHEAASVMFRRGA